MNTPRFNSPFSTREMEELQVVDWAESLTGLSKAVRHLEDAIPGGDLPKVITAFSNLSAHQRNLEKFLILRGVVTQADKDAGYPKGPEDETTG